MSSASKRRVAYACVAGAVITAAAMTMRMDGSARTSARSGRTAGTTPSANAVAAPTAVAHDPHDLWVCADPNNMPFSSAREEGLENALGRLVAREMGRQIRYFWQPQRRGFIRTTLRAGNC